MAIDRRRDGSLRLEGTGLPISIDSSNQLLSVALTIVLNVVMNPSVGRTGGWHFDEVLRPNRVRMAVVSGVADKIHE